jgi:hypothetical protein
LFITVKALERWLSKRLVAQREAFTSLLVCSFANSIKKELMGKISHMCPNLKALAAAPWMEEDMEEMCSCCRRVSYNFDEDLSSGDSDGERARKEMEDELYDSDEW